MTEPLFGSLSPAWPTLPIPGGVGYGQPPLPLASRLGAPSPATINGGSIAPVASALPWNLGASLLPFVGQDITAGVPAPAVVAAIAIRRGQPMGPTNDQEIEEFIYDALDLIPGAGDVEVRCEGSRATLTGSVQHKRLKRDIGELTWSIPSIADVQNNIAIAARRRGRAAGRETEPGGPSPRKQG